MEYRDLRGDPRRSPILQVSQARELCLKIRDELFALAEGDPQRHQHSESNVLVHDQDGRKCDVKSTDFGVSHRIGNPNVANSAGTAFWRAPEVLKAKSEKLMTEEELKKQMFYSYAMTCCCEIITGKFVPFHGKVVDAFGFRVFRTPVIRSNDVIRGCRARLPVEPNADLVKLISHCWDDNPALRPDFSTICMVLANKSTWNSYPIALKDMNVEVKYNKRI